MIIALVQIPLEKLAHSSAEVVQAYLDSTPLYREVAGLRRKSYLCGGGGGGGVYEFENRESAEAWFHEGWADWMEGRFGVRPTLTLFESPVQIDNVAGEVRANGVPVEA